MTYKRFHEHIKYQKKHNNISIIIINKSTNLLKSQITQNLNKEKI